MTINQTKYYGEEAEALSSYILVSATLRAHEAKPGLAGYPLFCVYR